MARAANLDASAFAGTAEAYLRHRPPYPAAMLADLLAWAGAGADARVLDLASGPGRVALALAPHVGEVAAVDLEPEMIAAGKGEAARLGIANVSWTTGRAEDVAAAPGSFDLITIGDAFHRLEQPRIAALAIGWLKPGGAIATLGCPTILIGSEPWQQAVRAVAVEWTRAAFPEGWATSTAGETGPDHDAAVLRAAGFVDVANRSFVQPVTWSVEDVVGYLRSVSVCAPRIIGPDRAPFEAAVTAALLAQDPGGLYPENLTFGMTRGRKP